ncbi:MAG: hypothetical protein WBO29_10535 [Albidovulum sp.]
MQPDKTSESKSPVSDETACGGMRFDDLLRLTHDVRARVESEWQRLINANAALIAVMVFFASRQEPFMAARIIVFAFYSATVLTSVINLSQSYRGLRLLMHEMTHFPKPTVSAAVLKWLIRNDYRAESWLRLSLPVLVWILVAYLMILPLIMGRTTLLH